MTDYWLDSNVFVQGSRGPYGFDIAPSFWILIDGLAADGRIACPLKVCDELLDGLDELANWGRVRRASGLFVDPDTAVQVSLREIAAYVGTRYRPIRETQRFLDKADPWVIAHAHAKGGKVVTLEKPVPNDSKIVKIPNVCHHFHVESISTYQMLRELGVSW